tara:strand:- start:11831 stop:12256 length:426 start_codon:yes stop_codon:yes gene_type:complete
MGCATMKESLLLGTGIGAISGAVLNSQIDRDNDNAKNNGAMIGAVVGLATSYFIHGSLEDRDNRVRQETLLNLDRFNVSRPSIASGEDDPSDYFVTQPRVETQCFDSDVRGNKLIEAHCESVIVERPEWAKRHKKKPSGGK